MNPDTLNAIRTVCAIGGLGFLLSGLLNRPTQDAAWIARLQREEDALRKRLDKSPLNRGREEIVRPVLSARRRRALRPAPALPHELQAPLFVEVQAPPAGPAETRIDPTGTVPGVVITMGLDPDGIPTTPPYTPATPLYLTPRRDERAGRRAA